MCTQSWDASSEEAILFNNSCRSMKHSWISITLNEIDNLLAYSTPVPLLYLAWVRVYSFLVDFEDGSDISTAHNLLTLAEELQGQKQVIHHVLEEGTLDVPADRHPPWPWWCDTLLLHAQHQCRLCHENDFSLINLLYLIYHSHLVVTPGIHMVVVRRH